MEYTLYAGTHFHRLAPIMLHSQLPPMFVSWKPPQRFLHYEALYRGLYEFLREPPDYSQLSRAVRYLHRLKACYHPSNVLQFHRILWVQAWLDAIPDPLDSDLSDAETVVGE